MMAKFANLLARNISAIAQNTVTIALLDAGQGSALDRAESRVACKQAIEKAERNIAEVFKQPGAWRED